MTLRAEHPLAPLNLDPDSMAPGQRDGHIGDVIIRPISGRPPKLTDGVVGFRTSHHLKSMHRNSIRNVRQSDGYSHGWWRVI